MDFSKILHGFVKIDTWISLSVYTDLLELTYGFPMLFNGFVNLFTMISLS